MHKGFGNLYHTGFCSLHLGNLSKERVYAVKPFFSASQIWPVAGKSRKKRTGHFTRYTWLLSAFLSMKPKDPSLMNKYVKIRTCRCYVIVKDFVHILAAF